MTPAARRISPEAPLPGQHWIHAADERNELLGFERGWRTPDSNIKP
jgi:hypothetical protein